MDVLIFDADGALADREEAHRQAFNAAFERAGLDWHWSRAVYRDLVGLAGARDCIDVWIDHLDTEPRKRARWREEIPRLHADETRLYADMVAGCLVPLRPGVARLLIEARAAGWHVAIAGTTTAADIDALLHAELGPWALGMFSAISCGDIVPAGKPAADVYQSVLGALEIPPEAAVAVEGSTAGLRAAMAAGVRAIVTPTYWTKGADFSGAALVLPHLGEPGREIDGEPGGRLRHAGWLTMNELMELRDAR